ncbi:MAG: phenylalanine--tRNA ligase subunit beta [Patescibacteria group bacterium]|nr:phenylalanine--tRNA ligase subunit beta [Patescibacteria group bacterium]
MKISYNWLQTYFKKESLPSPEKLAELFTFHFSEVEGMEKIGGDTVFDIHVLPDRACYALSHRGVAREVSAILDIPLKKIDVASINEAESLDPDIGIEEPELCTKFVARRMENIKVGESPQWLRERLEAIGQRSINNVVDATNYVMFDIGRPLHAFDADKIKGKLVVRSAKHGDVVVTLDDKRVALSKGELVMADDEGPVGLAGIKGGKRTEVDVNTKNLTLEAANWSPIYIRRTAISSGIRTEASKRFENKISPLLGEEGIDRVTRLIAEIASTPEMKIGKRIAVSFEKTVQKNITVTADEVAQRLGVPVSEDIIIDSLRRLGISSEKNRGEIRAYIPDDRLDLEIPEDIAEEVGRIIGYDKVPLVLPPKTGAPLAIPKSFYWEWKIREFLVSEGFSEVMTSSFANTGEVAIEKPLAEDKKYARSELRGSFAVALEMNARNAPLFGGDEVRMFEIGKVFSAASATSFAQSYGRSKKAMASQGGERASLAIGYAGPKSRRPAGVGVPTGASGNKGVDIVGDVIKKLSSALGAEFKGETKEGVFECDLDTVTEKLFEPKSWDFSPLAISYALFKPFSSYPFIVRDVALFVPAGTKPEDVLDCIRKEAGELAVRSWKFDEFEKGGKQSFAFRIVFQSFEKTLTDVEANAVMENIYVVLKKEFHAEIR